MTQKFISLGPDWTEGSMVGPWKYGLCVDVSDVRNITVWLCSSLSQDHDAGVFPGALEEEWTAIRQATGVDIAAFEWCKAILNKKYTT